MTLVAPEAKERNKRCPGCRGVKGHKHNSSESQCLCVMCHFCYTEGAIKQCIQVRSEFSNLFCTRCEEDHGEKYRRDHNIKEGSK